MLEVSKCQNARCGKYFGQTKSGRIKKYCSDACRLVALRDHKGWEEGSRKALVEQHMEKQWMKLPAETVRILRGLQRSYGIFAAYEATKAVMIALGMEAI